MGSYQKIWDIEALIAAHALVESCVLVGEHEDYLSALISPNKRHLACALEEHYPGMRFKLERHVSLNCLEIRALYCDLLEEINAQVKAKRIERFTLVDFDSRKTREQICQEHQVLIESFYQEYIAGVG